MGLLKSISKATGIKAFGEVESFLGDPTGAKAASRAQVASLIAAGKFEEAFRIDSEAFRELILDQTALFRETARTEFKDISEAAPGESVRFKQAFETGTAELKARFESLGLGDSTALATATSQLTARLLSEEEQTRQATLANLANIGQAGFGSALGAQQIVGAATGRQAQTIADIGAARAIGEGANRGFFTDILGTAGGVAIGSALFSGPAAAAGTTGGAAGGAAGGLFQLNPLGPGRAV